MSAAPCPAGRRRERVRPPAPARSPRRRPAGPGSRPTSGGCAAAPAESGSSSMTSRFDELTLAVGAGTGGWAGRTGPERRQRRARSVSPAQLRGDQQLAAVRLRQPPAERQAQAGAGLAAPLVAHLAELLEDLARGPRGRCPRRCRSRRCGASAIPPGLDGDPAALRRELDGVGERGCRRSAAAGRGPR